LFLWGYDTRCIEKEVSKVPIFEDGTFKYLPFTTTTTTNTTSTTTTHFQKVLMQFMVFQQVQVLIYNVSIAIQYLLCNEYFD